MKSRILTLCWFPFVCLSVRTPLSFCILIVRFSKFFFVWKVWHERPNFYTFCPSVCPSVHSVHLSFCVLIVRFSKLFFFVWKVWHQRPKFYTFCPSVYASVCSLSFYVLTVRFNFFCLKGITSETFFYTFGPSVRTPFTFRSNNQIFKNKKKNQESRLYYFF